MSITEGNAGPRPIRAQRESRRGFESSSLLDIAALGGLFVIASAVLHPLFGTWLFIVPLLVALASSVAVALLLHLREARFEVGLLAQIVAWLLFLAVWVVVSAPGALGDALDAWRSAIGGSWASLLSTPPPIDPSVSSLAGPTLVVWLGAHAGISAIMRQRPAVAIAPLLLAWFFFTASGHNSSGPGWVQLALVVGLVVFLAGRGTSPDQAGMRAFASRSLPAASAIALVAAAVWFVTSPLDETDRWSPRSSWDPTVSIISEVSPLSLIKPQLSEAAAVEGDGDRVLTIIDTGGYRGDALYLRSAVLDIFDGALWSASGTYVRTGQALPSAESSADRPLEMTIRLDGTPAGPAEGLAAYVSIPGQPVRVDGIAVAYNESATTLAADPDKRGLPGQTYTVTAVVAPGITDIARPLTLAPTDADTARLTSLPQAVFEIDEDLQAFRAEAGLTDSSAAPEALLALRELMRGDSFAYGISLPQGHSLAAIRRYVGDSSITRARVGFGEQAASTYAVMARLMGVPSRVVVGYRVELPEELGTTVEVETGDAHAWVEVRLGDVGWTRVDPIVRKARVIEPPDPLAPEQAGVISSPDAPPLPAQFQPPPEGSGTQVRIRNSLPWRIMLGALIAALAFVPCARLARRALRRRESKPRLSVLAAWHDVVDSCIDHGLAVPKIAVETDIAESALGFGIVSEPAPIRSLARLASMARWSPQKIEPDVAREAWSLSKGIRREIRGQTALRKNVRAGLRPQSFLGVFGRSRGPMKIELQPLPFGDPTPFPKTSLDEPLIDLRDQQRDIDLTASSEPVSTSKSLNSLGRPPACWAGQLLVPN